MREGCTGRREVFKGSVEKGMRIAAGHGFLGLCTVRGYLDGDEMLLDRPRTLGKKHLDVTPVLS
jgi:hypothetical protein